MNILTIFVRLAIIRRDKDLVIMIKKSPPLYSQGIILTINTFHATGFFLYPLKTKKNNILQTFATLPHFGSKQSCSFNLSFGNGVNDLPIPGRLPQKYLVRYCAETSFALITTGRHSKNRLMISRSEYLIPTTFSKNQKNGRELIGFGIA